MDKKERLNKVIRTWVKIYSEGIGKFSKPMLEHIAETIILLDDLKIIYSKEEKEKL